MKALPSDLYGAVNPIVTGITCPDCAGSLSVQREGRGTLRFTCRVGHAMSVDELLSGKEDKIEEDLWACVRGIEELIALLEDLEAYARAHGREQIGGPHARRIAQARAQVQRLRQLIDETQPVDLEGADPAVGAGPSAMRRRGAGGAG